MSLPPPGTPIILDIGSAYVKIGFAGESNPRFVFPCITGTEKYQAVMVDVGARSVYVGNDAMKMRGVLKVKYPIQRGAIVDWNEYYEILNHIFYNLLRIEDLSQYPVIYAEHPFVPKETKEYIARVLFETHNVNSLIMMESPILSSFSVGLTTSLVVESGDGVTWIVPIINGQLHHQAVQRLNLAGFDINQNLKALMMQEGINITSSAADEILKEIKEKNCYFVLDPRNPPKNRDEVMFPMPDGTMQEIPNRVLYEAPEVMFQPSMLGYNIMNIAQAVIYCLQLVNKEHWNELLTHIVFSGGNLSYSGFEERFKQELNQLLPQLGSIPKPKKKKKDSSSHQNMLKSIISDKKERDTCPECGEVVDLSEDIDTCPACGASLQVPKVEIGLGGDDSSPTVLNQDNCPFCGKKIKDKSSSFCPYCGKPLEVTQKSPKFMEPEAAPEFVDTDSSDELLTYFIPDNLQTSIFNGASILGSLPSFQSLFITQQEFQATPEILYQDIS
ncbi:MAG: zinc-ribbon domain-containing protein, partial [Candidatus Lokiarchaeota archaeon]|nr:zinc-ribbon domain-containing protein [Candidatus Lokiarchaeota archaeon]